MNSLDILVRATIDGEVFEHSVQHGITPSGSPAEQATAAIARSVAEQLAKAGGNGVNPVLESLRFLLNQKLTEAHFWEASTETGNEVEP